jgi:hypothetical protein
MRVSKELRQQLFEESRNQCAICGSRDFLQLAHITPISIGGASTLQNMIVLCATCHVGVDSSRISAERLREIKRDWVEKSIAGKEKISKAAQSFGRTSSSLQQWNVNSDLVNWSEALQRSNEFDNAVRTFVDELSGVGSENDFIYNILKPLFDAMGYEGVTCLHHTGRHEYGKDIVFYERDKLGGFTYYAVVACISKIHATSSRAKTRDSGHYQKIIDQVEKCFSMPYEDYNLKGEFYIDKVIVACAGIITEEAMKLFREWENRKRRRLIFLNAESIAGHKLRLHIK